MIGSTGLGCAVTAIPPGKRAYPFRRHHVIDELFYILSGAGEYRIDDKKMPLRAGDLVAAPAGKEAHQIINTQQKSSASWRSRQSVKLACTMSRGQLKAGRRSI